MTTWLPQPGPQSDFVLSEVFEVIYGGARGGGKTDGVLGDFALHPAKQGPRYSRWRHTSPKPVWGDDPLHDLE